jgi:hypothetical protein
VRYSLSSFLPTGWHINPQIKQPRQKHRKTLFRLLSDITAASDAEISRRLDELEEFDSSAPTSLYNPARNRASIELRLTIEPLTTFEKLMAFVAGGIPK